MNYQFWTPRDTVSWEILWESIPYLELNIHKDLQLSSAVSLSTADLRTFAPLTWNKPLISNTEECSHQELVSLDTEITENLWYIMKLNACYVRNLFESYFGLLASVLSRTKRGKAVSEEIN